jgi:hypothetical protein
LQTAAVQPLIYAPDIEQDDVAIVAVAEPRRDVDADIGGVGAVEANQGPEPLAPPGAQFLSFLRFLAGGGEGADHRHTPIRGQ